MIFTTSGLDLTIAVIVGRPELIRGRLEEVEDEPDCLQHIRNIDSPSPSHLLSSFHRR